MEKILLIEDDLDILEMTKSYFEDELYTVITCGDGATAIEQFTNNQAYDVVLLDIMLPKKSGVEVLQHIRKESVVPVIVVSAKDGEFDKTTMLELGADDYVVKPFSLSELHARVKSVIRRSTIYGTHAKNEAQNSYQFLDLKLDIDSHVLYKEDKKIELTQLEFSILTLFFKKPKKVFTKEEIYESVWKESYFGDENIINVQMSRLRDKIEDDKKHPKYIETLWGIGYRMRDNNDKE